MFKQGKSPKIHVKESHKGKFTAWAKSHGYNVDNGIPAAAIEEGLASRLASVRKQAQFAKNAKSFQH